MSASLTFSLNVFCSEINDLVKENKLSLVYIYDNDFGTKCYLFSDLDSVEIVNEKERKDEKNKVDKIDYRNMNEMSIRALIDDLTMLFLTKKYKQRFITTLIMNISKYGYKICKNINGFWEISSEYYNYENEQLIKEEREYYNSKIKKEKYTISSF